MKKARKYLILGYGVSGKAAAKLCAYRKIPFCVIERDPAGLSSDDKMFLEKSGACIYSEDLNLTSFKPVNIEAVVISPGVNPSHKVIKWADENGILVLSEIGFAFNFLKGVKIGVTGTNGKTTTVTLLSEIFNNAGKKAVGAGNIGTALSEIVFTDCQPDIIVMELSSYQLERFSGCMLDGAIMTNVSSDHCERYTCFNDYVKAKLNIETNLKKGAYFICMENDSRFYMELINQTEIPESWCLIDIKSGSRNSFYADETGLWFKNDSGWELVINKNEFNLAGKHMFTNCAMAAQAAYFSGVGLDDIINTIKSFKGLPHRLEKLGSINGITFFNDSKATNVDAVVKALSNFDKTIVLILGGQDKGSDLTELKKVVEQKVSTAVLIGESTGYYEKVFSKCAGIIKADNMEDAVLKAYNNANFGDIVLLSPACASFDMYENFEHRGSEFKKAVKKIQHLSYHN